MISLMTASGLHSEAFLALTAIDELRRLEVRIAEVLEKYGWIDSEGLHYQASDNVLSTPEKRAELVLAYAGSCGLGEYTRRGLFYRRPFLREKGTTRAHADLRDKPNGDVARITYGSRARAG